MAIAEPGRVAIRESARQHQDTGTLGARYRAPAPGAVRSLSLSEDEQWLYVGDSLGNITPLAMDL